MHLMQLFIPLCTEKCIEYIDKSENVIFSTLVEVYPFKLMQKSINCLQLMIKVHQYICMLLNSTAGIEHFFTFFCDWMKFINDYN